MEISLLLVSVVGIGYLVLGPPKTAPDQSSSPAPLPPAKAAGPSQTGEVLSVDGNQKLIMKKASLPDGSSDYVFYVADNSGQRLLFTKPVGPAGSLTLPPNSWSPDNKYLFLVETLDGSTLYLVFKASGEKFADGQAYLEVSSLFAKNKTGYQIKDVTGWDSSNLMHVLTVTEQKANGPKYWFDVDSRVFLQLAS